MYWALTRQVGHGLEFLQPVVGDLDGLGLGVLAVGGHPLLVRVSQQLLEVLRVDRVQDVEEVRSGRPLAVRVFVGEVLDEFRIFLELRIQRLDADLVVVRHRDLLHDGLLHQFLLPGEDLLEEVLVDLLHRRQIVLDCTQY